MTTSPNLALQELDSPPAITAELQVNEALRRLDALVDMRVKDRNLATPPGSPAQGDRYLIDASPTGAWSGQAGKLTYYVGTGWVFVTPQEGKEIWVDDENVKLRYDGSAWLVVGTQAATVADISGTPSTTDLKNKVNDLLASLRASGLLAP